MSNARRIQARPRATEHQETSLIRFNSPMAHAKRIQARDWETVCVSQVPAEIHKVTMERVPLDAKREQQKASFSSERNESPNPCAQALGDRLQSKEDADSEFVNQSDRTSQNNARKFRTDELP